MDQKYYEKTIVSFDAYQKQLKDMMKAIKDVKKKNPDDELRLPPLYISITWKDLISESVYKDKSFSGKAMIYMIMNSIKNRKLNLLNDDVLADKLAYGIGIIHFIRKYNQLPTSIIIDLEGYKCQLAKDRGHTSYVLVNLTKKKYKLNVWKKVLKFINEDSHNYDGVETIDNIELKINQKEAEFSLEDVVPSEDWKVFLDSPISIEISPETMHNHIGEIDGLNNGGNDWTDHQRGMNKPEDILVYDTMGAHEKDFIDKVYDIVAGKKVFQGYDKEDNKIAMKSVKGSSNPSGYEEEAIWVYRATKCSNNNLVDKIKGLTNRKVQGRKTAYALALSKSKVNDFKNDAEFMQKVAESQEIENFDGVLSGVVKEWKKKAGKKTAPANLRDLSLAKVDSFQAFCLMVEDALTRAYGPESKKKWSFARKNFMTNKILRNAISSIEDPITVRNLIDPSLFAAGLEGRYEGFWRACVENAIIESSKSNEIKSKDELLDLYAKQMSSLPSNKDFSIFDMVSETDFRMIKVNLTTGKNLEDGHKKTVKHDTFLQPPAANKLLGENSINDIEGYADDYMKCLKNFLDSLSDVTPEMWGAFGNTDVLAKCWKKVQ